MTPKEETIDALRFWQAKENTDLAHTEADEILCWFLREIGHSDVVDEWSKVCNRATCSLSRGRAFMTWDNRYRPLREGETILSGDECLTDSHLGWQPAKHDIGGKAPDPNYTAHRMYRRLRDAPAPRQEQQ